LTEEVLKLAKYLYQHLTLLDTLSVE
jgi:hypothetical protein